MIATSSRTTETPGRDLAAGWRLAYSARGASGPAVVFLHGLGASGRFWGDRVEPLARQFRLFVPDLLGFGRSPWPNANYTIALHLAVIRRLVADLALDRGPLAMVGHSLGATLALEYAARYPNHVRRLVLFSLPCYTDAAQAREAVRREGGFHELTVAHRGMAAFLCHFMCRGNPLWRAIWPRLKRDLPADVVRDANLHTWNSFSTTLDNCILEHDLQPAFEATRNVPIRLVHGTRDRSAPLAGAQALTAKYSDVRLTLLEGADHCMFLRCTDQCLQAIADHLEPIITIS